MHSVFESYLECLLDGHTYFVSKYDVRDLQSSRLKVIFFVMYVSLLKRHGGTLVHNGPGTTSARAVGHVKPCSL